MARIISKGEAVRQLCNAGVFGSYQEARLGGALDALTVQGLAYNMTTGERMEALYGVKVGATEEDERYAAHGAALLDSFNRLTGRAA